MKIIPRVLFSFTIFVNLLCFNIQNVTAATVNKSVLLLFAGQPDSSESILASQKLRSTFGSVSDVTIDFYSEYLDSDRFSGENDAIILRDLYRQKYGDKPIDLVVTFGDTSFNFWLKYRQEILPNTPVVTFGMLSTQLTGQILPADVTGVYGDVDYTLPVNWLMSVKPSINEIVIIYGPGPADQAYLMPVIELKTIMGGRVKLTDWSSLPWAEIKAKAAALPPTSVIVFHRINTDSTGVHIRSTEDLRDLTRAASVPVIGGYDYDIGSGIIGGYLCNIEEQAGLAARMGLRILRGEAVSAIPMTAGPANQYVFDEQALKRWDIPVYSLPPGSITRNHETSLWDTYKFQIIFICTVFLVLVVLAAILLGLNRKLKTTQKKLENLNSNLETQVNDRTMELIKTNFQLHDEIKERMKGEETLRLYTKQLEEMQYKLQQQTIRDPLTGAFNRRYLIETLDREMANSIRNGYPLCLMMMDIDHFKKVNDTYGHQAGDEVLKRLVGLLEQTTRKGDVVCRYGGEEFVVLLPRISLKDAVERAEAWRKILQSTEFKFGGRAIGVTISIGISSNMKIGINGDQLLSHADQALLVAKKTGRNRVIAVK